MLDNYLLEELATFAECKTLAKTAEKLHMTQPSITRGTKKLEEELGVQLFERYPNHITLTKTGELAAQVAAHIIKVNQEGIEKIRNFDQSQHSIQLGVTIPGPRILLQHLKVEFPDNVHLNPELLSEDSITSLLEKNEYTLIFSDQEIFTDQVESRYLGDETMSVHLNQFMYLASQSSVAFKDLKGLSFLVLSCRSLERNHTKCNSRCKISLSK
ncbi:LysR family transcriptional regulator [Lactobacillus selangorensis]|uniref:LysR family transcriptional regulator n=1 Tax=Lactobacillus selangorensis TaxID=81857 RepID=A0A0R2FU02_9LACO|nr:LysR family transcriptional regulator [Lactobacillus selangorensis]KRN28684.1 LysR family transcriptional regulator [Lactobacillus selangorensis]KRN32905.1 LysR family transcriptional regulator [Lactobacillus selangorensis]